MKKRTITSLALNKSKISLLQHTLGGRLGQNTDGPTMSGCSCESCNPDCNTQNASTLGCTE